MILKFLVIFKRTLKVDSRVGDSVVDDRRVDLQWTRPAWRARPPRGGEKRGRAGKASGVSLSRGVRKAARDTL